MSGHDDQISLKDMLGYAREAVKLPIVFLRRPGRRIPTCPGPRSSVCVTALFMVTMSSISICCGIR